MSQPAAIAFSFGPTVLVADDDDDMAGLLRLTLEKAGARVVHAYSGVEALRQAFEHRPDIVLLDIAMPDLDGLTVCQRLREMSDIPIIMITAFNRPDNLTRAFAYGADDYVAKPFDVAELLARIQACLRRAPRSEGSEDNLMLGQGDIIIDLRRHQVSVRQEDVHLTKTEFELLVYLARNRGRVLTHAMLRTAIGLDDTPTGQTSLKQFIAGVRRKIEADPGNPHWLVSEHSVGYALVV